MIDDKDEIIANNLQNNGRMPNAEIARRLDMAPSAVFERIRKLEESGVIAGYEAKLHPESFGLGLLAFVLIRTNDHVGELKTAHEIAKIPWVQEIHDVAGDDCYVVKLRARDTRHLGEIMKKHFGGMKSILSTRTTIVLETIKESGKLPLETVPLKKGK